MLINNLPFLQSMISNHEAQWPYWTPLYNKTFLRTTKITFKKLSDNANNNDEGEYYAQKQDSFWVITDKKK